VTNNLKLYFVIQNSYFDSSDFSENPIVKTFKPYFISSALTNLSIFYYVPLSFNDALINDNILFSD
jgi:hypothetical protein